jgi:hypothetical protein
LNNLERTAGVNFGVNKIASQVCTKCGAPIPVNNISAKSHEDKGVLFVRYDPAYTKIVLINNESGLRHTVDLSTQKQSPEPKSRQIGGIIGPY